MRFDPTILVLDGGHPQAQALARAVRALGFFSLVQPADAPAGELEAARPAAVLWAQGPAGPRPEVSAQADLRLTPAGVLEGSRAGLKGDYRLYWPPPPEISADTMAALAGFLLGEKQLRPAFSVGLMLAEAEKEIRSQVGPDGQVLLAISGGVDSSVCAALIHRAIGSRLRPVFVDHGLMRRGEPQEVAAALKGKLGLDILTINAQARFLKELAGVTDPEQKRKIIGRVFIEVFEEEATQMGQVNFLGQGTIYPDIIESVAPAAGGAPVKSHHNVGGLPERLNLKLLEPLKYLFKDEVRELGLGLGLDRQLVFRQPFPGPGLGVRCLGEITASRLDTLRAADALVREAIEQADLPARPWQYFAALLPVGSVGVKNGARVYGEVIALRAIHTTDAMTAEPADLPLSFLAGLAREIIEQVPGISRVVYDISPKPPATIEWE